MIPRILKLRCDHGIPGTFLVPAHVAERQRAVIEAITGDGHGITHHGYTHENVYGLGEADERALFAHATEILRRIADRRPRGWSAPDSG